MTQNQNQPASRQPLAKTDEIAVFLNRNIDVQGREVPIYSIGEGKRGETKRYAEAYGEVSGTILSPENVLAIYQGYPVELTLKSRAGKDYLASVVGAGVEEKPWKASGKSGVNRKLQVGIVAHAIKATGEHFGYNIDHVLVFKTAGSKDSPIELNACAAWDLVQGGVGTELEIRGNIVRLNAIDEKVGDHGVSKTAKIGVEYVQQEEQGSAENEAPEEEEGVKL